MKTLSSLLGPILAAWLLCVVLISVPVGLVAITVQQDLRQGADDPQIQMAEDTARALEAGQAPHDLVSSTPVEMRLSLAPYLIIFDDAGQMRASAAVLDGAPPVLPAGVFDNVRRQGEARFTWQPLPGVRSAAVVRRVGGGTPGFVLAGRSLRVVEEREDNLRLLALLAWGAGVVLALGGSALLVGTLRYSQRA